jgi:hypothetical protein
MSQKSPSVSEVRFLRSRYVCDGILLLPPNQLGDNGVLENVFTHFYLQTFSGQNEKLKFKKHSVFPLLSFLIFHFDF